MTLKLLKPSKPFPPRWPPSTCFFTCTALPFKFYMHNKATRPRGWQTLYCHKLIPSTFFNRFAVASQPRSYANLLKCQLWFWRRPNLVPRVFSLSNYDAVKHAFLSAEFSHNCARIPNIFAQKVYPIKDVINFSRLRGWDAFLKEDLTFLSLIGGFHVTSSPPC